MPLPEDYKEQLIQKLKEKGVKGICQLCGKNNWSTVDQAVSLHISDLKGGLVIPPPQIPCAALVCQNCGNVRLLALGALDLLPQDGGRADK